MKNKKVMFVMFAVCILVLSATLVSGFSIGETKKGNIVTDVPLISEDDILHVPPEIRQAQINLGEVSSYDLMSNETQIWKAILVDNSYTAIAVFENDDEYQWIDAGDQVLYIALAINVSKAYAPTAEEAINYTRVYLTLIKQGEGFVSFGYASAYGVYDMGTFYEVDLTFPLYYTFDEGQYLITTAYDVYVVT